MDQKYILSEKNWNCCVPKIPINDMFHHYHHLRVSHQNETGYGVQLLKLRRIYSRIPNLTPCCCHWTL